MEYVNQSEHIHKGFCGTKYLVLSNSEFLVYRREHTKFTIHEKNTRQIGDDTNAAISRKTRLKDITQLYNRYNY